jgi:hypothetical protein
MTEETDGLDPEEARLRRVTERYVKAIGGNRRGFLEGVKKITKEKEHPARAVSWYRRFIRSRTDTEEHADAQIELNKAEGFGFMQLATLRRDFAKWKPLEISRSAKQRAKQSVEKRRKRGRVKSKNDKRLGGRSPGS